LSGWFPPSTVSAPSTSSTKSTKSTFPPHPQLRPNPQIRNWRIRNPQSAIPRRRFHPVTPPRRRVVARRGSGWNQPKSTLIKLFSTRPQTPAPPRKRRIHNIPPRSGARQNGANLRTNAAH
jgi:hypothetical protein